MKVAGMCAALACGLASAGAAAQDAGDAMEKLRACSLLAQAERLACLEKLSRDLSPSPPPGPAAPAGTSAPPTVEDWTVSETTSPIDYTPVAIATATSGSGPDGAPLQVSIQCRGGRTELLIRSPTLARRGEDHLVSYAIDDGAPVTLAAGTPASGTGIAVKADVVRLLTSLPDRGTVTLRVEARQGGAAVQGRYSLSSLKTVRDRLAVPCRWRADNVPRTR